MCYKIQKEKLIKKKFLLLRKVNAHQIMSIILKFFEKKKHFFKNSCKNVAFEAFIKSYRKATSLSASSLSLGYLLNKCFTVLNRPFLQAIISVVHYNKKRN